MKKTLIALSIMAAVQSQAQTNLTPEKMWQLGRVSAIGITKDQKSLIYSVGTPDLESNKIPKKYFSIPVSGGQAKEIEESELKNLISDKNISPDGKYVLSAEEVHLMNVEGKDIYKDLPKTSAAVYTSPNYRHWDTWFNGNFSHVFLAPTANPTEKKDLLKDQPYFCPQQPFGGDEDYVWDPNSQKVIYVTKPKFGTAYAISTNTDLFEYDLKTGKTINITESNKGYDIAPQYNSVGELAWMQQKRDGYEADKQDLVVRVNDKFTVNLTHFNDQINVASFKWAQDNKNLFFIAPIDGTMQLFQVNNIGKSRMLPRIQQITKGDFDIDDIIGQLGNTLLVSRQDMNHATEIFSVDIASGKMEQLTHVNDNAFKNIAQVKVERRWVTTSDKQKMMEWIVLPPNFDPNKKYPTLLYCQGGPQSPTTQFYSFRWNFQLMASQGYIVVVPSRRGMPGFGTKWNEAVSKDWGGQVIQDYLDATDDISKEKYVDTARRGAIGASFGGFSIYELAGKHEGRFKSFIAHDGVFDFVSMYGTTDEMWFENWEKGGPYWEKDNKVAQRSFAQSPSNFVQNWNTPIMIVQGGIDYRVPIEQGLGAFKAAQLKGIKSKLLYFPDENHWVLKPQNAMVWQREFFSWLKETL